MKKQAGFTLIELVIVIVILGILGAVAAPKFLNLQGDAYGANLDTVKNAMESSSTLVNTKAVLAGQDCTDTAADVTIYENGVSSTVSVIWGYPEAAEEGILEVLEINASSASSTSADYLATVVGENFVVRPQARQTGNCYVQYTEATSQARPTISVVKDGC